MNFTLRFFVSEGTFINLHYSDVNLSKQFVRSKSKIIGAPSYDPLSTHTTHIQLHGLCIYFRHPPQSRLIFNKQLVYSYIIFTFTPALSFLFERSHKLYHIILNRYLCYDPSLSLEKKKQMKFAPIRSKKSCFFEHKEIKKPLQLPEILSPLKAQKQRVSC